MNQNDTLVKIYTSSGIQINLLKSLLEEYGIASLIKDPFLSGIRGGIPYGVPSAVDLYVFEKDRKEAEAIIAEFLIWME